MGDLIHAVQSDLLEHLFCNIKRSLGDILHKSVILAVTDIMDVLLT